MKKFLIIFLVFIVGSIQSCFADVLPRYTHSIKHTGIGAFNAPKEFSVYEEPDLASKKIVSIKWNEEGLIAEKNYESDLFVVFLPSRNIAYCSVEDEIDGWVKIYYSQKKGKSGWVKTDSRHRFVSWFGFYMSWGRKNGVYLFNDMPEINKRIMSAPDASSQRISGFTYPKHIQLTLVRGNWMLVKMLDFGDIAHVGWLQWRDENAKFLMFPFMYR